MVSYKKPYPEWFDQVLLPPRYTLPDFIKFTGMDSVSTMEHISQYLAQLGEIADEPALKVRFFPLSLSRPTFSWFASLPHNSIEGWEDLETKFHHYFDSGVMEKGITDLVDVRQRNNEPALHYL
jgi:hypothetical protein